MTFVPDFKAPSNHEISDLWFFFNKGKLLTRIENGQHRVPAGADLVADHYESVDELYLGVLDSRRCYGATINEEDGLHAKIWRAR